MSYVYNTIGRHVDCDAKRCQTTSTDSGLRGWTILTIPGDANYPDGGNVPTDDIVLHFCKGCTAKLVLGKTWTDHGFPADVYLKILREVE